MEWNGLCSGEYTRGGNVKLYEGKHLRVPHGVNKIVSRTFASILSNRALFALMMALKEVQSSSSCARSASMSLSDNGGGSGRAGPDRGRYKNGVDTDLTKFFSVYKGCIIEHSELTDQFDNPNRLTFDRTTTALTL